MISRPGDNELGGAALHVPPARGLAGGLPLSYQVLSALPRRVV